MSDVVQLTPELTEITDGLRFPEGPIAMPDGSVVLVEMFGPRLTRVAPDGTKSTIAEIEGGPNGAAVGPDGAIYLCNNGGCFAPAEFGGMMFPGAFVPDRYVGGRIQRVDPHDGTVTDLYTECDGRPLRAPERSGDGRPRRVLLHRSRHPRPRRPHQRPDGDLLRARRMGPRSGRSCSRWRAPTASACRRTPTRCTGPRRRPGGCSGAPS